MFNTLRRWLGTRDEDVDASALASWAGDHGYVVHRDLEQGWVSVEGRFGQRPWQLEYGPPQRHYIEGRELRLWTDLELPPAPHLLLMSRSLLGRLETLGVEIASVRFDPADTEAASMEEVRCVAMYAKVALAGTPGLRPHFGMVASEPIAAQAWLHGRLGDRLARFGAEALQAAPFLLMLRRGRVHLRLQAPHLSVALLEQVIDLYQVATDRAAEVLTGWTGESNSAWANTLSATWHADEPGREPPAGHPPIR